MVPRFVKVLGRNHSKCMAEHIRDSWEKECYSNVVFVCKNSGLTGQTLSANKSVLAVGSKKLHQLLSDTADEDVTIFVPESDFCLVKMLLQYIYTGEVLVNNFLDELESLIFDWEISLPEVSPVAAPTTKPASSLLLADPLSLETDQSNNFFDEGASVADLWQNISDGQHSPASTSKEKVGAMKKRKAPMNDHVAEKKKNTGALKRKSVFDNVQPMINNTEKATEEDKADSLLSQAFYMYEKNRSEELNSSITELESTIQRHELYLKHFKGVDPSSLPHKKRKTIKKSPVPVTRMPCEQCGKEIHPDYMKTHLETVHGNGERSFLCDQCGAAFTTTKNLRSHIRTVHAIPSHTCKVCNKSYKNREYLQHHMLIHTGDRPFECPYCDKKFRSRNVLVKHKRVHTGERPYGPCEFCGRSFKARTSYVKHLLSHTKKPSAIRNFPAGTSLAQSFDPETNSFKCSTCGHSFHREYAFLIHEAVHKKEEPKLPCLHCSNIFPSMKLLKDHNRKEHPESFFRCKQCPRFFASKINLDDHILTHLNQGETFPCTTCGKEFQTKRRLEVHVKAQHLAKTSFPCKFCPKKFTMKHTLLEHERIHTGERPFICPHCPKSFRVKAFLENHIRVHTGEKPFVCSHCGKAFAIKQNMDVHVKLHTGEKNQCATCGEIFRTQIKLKLHEQTHNEEERDTDSSVEGDKDE